MESERLSLELNLSETPDLNLTSECTPKEDQMEEEEDKENNCDVQESVLQELTKKRSVEEEKVPVLVRMPSETPSCSSDIIYINKDEFKIGRKPDNDAVILSVWISRIHCIIKHDQNTGHWFVTNLSSTDTLLNDEHIPRNITKLLVEGDILQLSLSDSFKYKFTLMAKGQESVKHPKLETNSLDLGNMLNEQKSFMQQQQNERIDLEKQLTNKQQEQEQLKQELDKLLEDQKVTKTCNQELNDHITELQKKIETGNALELDLQQKYRDLLGKLEEERLKFEEKLAEEKQKWQVELRKSKEEKEKLEVTMEEKRVEFEKKQQEEWQKKIEELLHEEKTVQTKLQDEKQKLEEKLKEMEETLKKREEEQAHQQALLAVNPPVEISNVAVMLEVTDTTESNELPILETIDLTDEDPSPRCSKSEEAVIDKVNHIMDEQMTCSICSELFVTAVTLNCSHTFCFYCIDLWIKKRRECPNCRATIITLTKSLVVDNFIERMVESLTPEQIEKRKQLIEERRVLTAANTRRKVVRIVKKR